MVSTAIGANFGGGVLAIAAAALAFAHVAPLAMIAFAAIVLGLALILAGPGHQDVASMPPEAFRYEDLARTSSGLMVIAGVASAMLGVLALFPGAPSLTLALIAILVVGAAELLAGGTLSSKFQRGAP